MLFQLDDIGQLINHTLSKNKTQCSFDGTTHNVNNIFISDLHWLHKCFDVNLSAYALAIKHFKKFSLLDKLYFRHANTKVQRFLYIGQIRGYNSVH